MHNLRCFWNSSLTPGKSLAAPKYLRENTHTTSATMSDQQRTVTRVKSLDRSCPSILSHSSYRLSSPHFLHSILLTCILCSPALPCLHGQASLVRFSVGQQMGLSIVINKRREGERRNYHTVGNLREKTFRFYERFFHKIWGCGIHKIWGCGIQWWHK